MSARPRFGALLLLALTVGCAGNDPTSSADAGDAGGATGTSERNSEAGGTSGADNERPGGASGAGNEEAGAAGAAGAPRVPSDAPPYASSVISFTAGDGAGFNEDKLPEIVLGPPKGLGTGQGSLDVLSLGVGGEIVLGFGELGIADGPGPDLIVFENSFWPGGNASQVFAELGEVSVSEDGEDWQTFPCDTAGDGEGHFSGCAGVTPTLAYDATEVVPLDPELTGGDVFDLADVGITHARFVRIRDLSTVAPAGTTSGFDLDAVGLIDPGPG